MRFRPRRRGTLYDRFTTDNRHAAGLFATSHPQLNRAASVCPNNRRVESAIQFHKSSLRRIRRFS